MRFVLNVVPKTAAELRQFQELCKTASTHEEILQQARAMGYPAAAIRTLPDLIPASELFAKSPAEIAAIYNWDMLSDYDLSDEQFDDIFYAHEE